MISAGSIAVMPTPGSRANLAPTTRTVLMLEYAFAQIRNDLHVAMPVHRKAAVRRYLVVVPDNEAPKSGVRGVALAIDSKVVPRLEPVAISTSKGVQSSQLQHRSHLADRACGASKARDQGG